MIILIILRKIFGLDTSRPPWFDRMARTSGDPLQIGAHCLGVGDAALHHVRVADVRS